MEISNIQCLTKDNIQLDLSQIDERTKQLQQQTFISDIDFYIQNMEKPQKVKQIENQNENQKENENQNYGNTNNINLYQKVDEEKLKNQQEKEEQQEQNNIQQNGNLINKNQFQKRDLNQDYSQNNNDLVQELFQLQNSYKILESSYFQKQQQNLVLQQLNDHLRKQQEESSINTQKEIQEKDQEIEFLKFIIISELKNGRQIISSYSDLYQKFMQRQELQNQDKGIENKTIQNQNTLTKNPTEATLEIISRRLNQLKGSGLQTKSQINLKNEQYDTNNNFIQNKNQSSKQNEVWKVENFDKNNLNFDTNKQQINPNTQQILNNYQRCYSEKNYQSALVNGDNNFNKQEIIYDKQNQPQNNRNNNNNQKYFASNNERTSVAKELFSKQFFTNAQKEKSQQLYTGRSKQSYTYLHSTRNDTGRQIQRQLSSRSNQQKKMEKNQENQCEDEQFSLKKSIQNYIEKSNINLY
ncbi:hypothetical protein PPERSA_08109 [Pseudocohnilembus persalinus]|uniref:Uncharacterized protein n=1 Tax=Pseudocohnilembus persalinus TaxID=266149 RepID=A0A0V0QLI2_PSEPJ|nr:hypothetical protein PPERSA_08109 [Pseudocohnilembus persalinus]|eukprot:KRX03034.1 hypothetical protein PPERSA_08109 [Pseudocohnilembus persalinus]